MHKGTTSTTAATATWFAARRRGLVAWLLVTACVHSALAHPAAAGLLSPAVPETLRGSARASCGGRRTEAVRNGHEHRDGRFRHDHGKILSQSRPSRGEESALLSGYLRAHPHDVFWLSDVRHLL